MTQRININSNWQFLKESCKIGELNNKVLENVNIPHTWNNLDGQDGGDDYHRGLCWYIKTFDIAKNINGRVYIEFEAVNSVANVWINGIHLGEHKGGYSLFRFDISEAIKTGSNEIIVSADNSHIEDVYPLFADFTFYGGIYRDVNIVYTDSVHFDLMDYGSSGVFVKQSAITSEKALLDIKARIRNFTDLPTVYLTAELKDSLGNPVAKNEKRINIAELTEFSVSLVLNNPILWNGRQNPYLYTCEVTISADNKVYDSISIPTGLRFFEFDGNKGFILNGSALKLNGVCRHQDREAVGNALSKSHQDEDMELIKEAGANSIRLAHYQHNKYFYELCDKNGMVVWAEIPYISRTSEVDDYAKNAISQMKELIKQNFNHPSIIMWGVQNEIGIFPDEKPLDKIVRTVNKIVKEIDTTRVTTQAQVMMIKEDDPSNRETDIVAFNQYHGWYVGDTSGYDKFINDFKKANPDKCMGYSEYGAEGILKWHSDNPKVKDYSEEYHAKYHEDVMATFNKYDFIWGTYVWNMFDFGSDMRDEGGILGRNNKGLVTFDRSTKKDAFFFYKSIWNHEPMIHICSKRFVERHTKTIKVKVYSNQREVTLYQNGKLVETKSSDGTIFVFEIKMKRGNNTITAKSGSLEDNAVYKKVRKQNMDYVLPASERAKGLSLDSLGPDENVANWFDTDDEIGEFLYPEGYFSIKDRITDIMDNSKGSELMSKTLKPLVEHSMFKFLKKQSLEAVFGFKPDAVPEAMKYKLNCELNKIKK